MQDESNCADCECGLNPELRRELRGEGDEHAEGEHAHPLRHAVAREQMQAPASQLGSKAQYLRALHRDEQGCRAPPHRLQRHPADQTARRQRHAGDRHRAVHDAMRRRGMLRDVVVALAHIGFDHEGQTADIGQRAQANQHRRHGPRQPSGGVAGEHQALRRHGKKQRQP